MNLKFDVGCLCPVALLASKEGDFQEAFTHVHKSLTVFPHNDAQELLRQLRQHFCTN